MKNIVILGGGAAGMAAAVAAAEQAAGQAKVILLEQNSRVGKKLLATGNGRCNLDNQTISPECDFTSDRKSMAKMLEAIKTADPLGWFEQHGLLWRADEAGRIYPYSNQAADMLNLLLHMLEKSGAEARTDCSIASERWASCLLSPARSRLPSRTAWSSVSGPDAGTRRNRRRNRKGT